MTNKSSTKKTPVKKKSDQSAASLVTPNTTFKLTLPWKKVKVTYDQTVKKHGKKTKLDGFRKGKAPTKLLESRLNKTDLINDTLNQLIPAAFNEEITKLKLKSLSQPEFKPLELEWEKDWVVEAAIAEEPQVKLGNYQKIVKAAKKKAPSPKKDAKTTPESESRQRNLVLQSIYQELITTIKPSVPELLLKKETEYELEELVRQLQSLKMSVDDYLKKRNQTFEQLSSELAARALGRLQLKFIIDAISQEENIIVSHDDVHEEIKKIQDPKLRESLEKDHQYHHTMQHQLVYSKTIDFLLKI